MTLKVVLPILSLGLALTACKGEVQIGSKTPEPAPQPTQVAPTPQPTAEAPKQEPPKAEPPKMILVGKLHQEGNRIVVPGNIEFASASATINMADPTTKEIMEGMTELMVKNPSLKIIVAGHTDNEGSEKYNQQLSEQRAAAVAKFMTDKGVTADRMKTEGHGMSKPLCKNDTAAHKKFNRRTEFVITELNGKPLDQNANAAPVCPDAAPAPASTGGTTPAPASTGTGTGGTTPPPAKK